MDSDINVTAHGRWWCWSETKLCSAWSAGASFTPCHTLRWTEDAQHAQILWETLVFSNFTLNPHRHSFMEKANDSFGCLYVKCLLSVILPSRPRFYASSCKPSPKQRSCTFCAISERSNRLMCTQSHLILPSLSVQFASMIWMKFSLLSDA